jgi:predicted RNA binding protein YcfA (HicA-like mRNA interferase family)
MSKRIPRVSGREAISAFYRLGFVEDRIKGSHHILVHPQTKVAISIPVHAGKSLGVGLLKSLLNAAGITVEEFVAQL